MFGLKKLDVPKQIQQSVIVLEQSTRLGICRGITSVLCLKQVLQTHRMCIGRVK